MLQWVPGPDDIRQTSSSFKWSKAASSDALHPKHPSLLSDDLLWGITEIMVKCLQLRAVPDIMTTLHMRLLGKKLQMVPTKVSARLASSPPLLEFS